MALLDSSVIAAYLDSGDALHSAATDRLRELDRDPRSRFIVSAVTFMEVLVGGHRGNHADAAIRRFFDRVVAEVTPFETATAERAAVLRARWGMRTPDAMILAAADLRGADLVLTGDQRWRSVDDVGPVIEILSL